MKVAPETTTFGIMWQGFLSSNQMGRFFDHRYLYNESIGFKIIFFLGLFLEPQNHQKSKNLSLFLFNSKQELWRNFKISKHNHENSPFHRLVTMAFVWPLSLYLFLFDYFFACLSILLISGPFNNNLFILNLRRRMIICKVAMCKLPNINFCNVH